MQPIEDNFALERIFDHTYQEWLLVVYEMSMPKG